MEEDLVKRWESDISYVKVRGKKYYMISFIDECSPYIIYHTSEINDLNEWKFCITL